MKFISNAFSLNMLERGPIGETNTFDIVRIDAEHAQNLLVDNSFKSVIGHRDLAGLVSEQVGVEIEFNRESVKVREGDMMIVCQYSGPRLPEGCTELPSGAQIDFYLVTYRPNL